MEIISPPDGEVNIGRNPGKSPFEKLNDRIVRCEGCRRLLGHCRKIAAEKKKSYAQWTYWGKPVPNFGDPQARVLIVGLAPAAHGANRTGRMFTGDRSGDWLYRALCRAGFANQETAVSVDDGLELKDCAITAVAHCAPPDNKPTPEEIANCRAYLEQTFQALPVKVMVALGGIAWKACLDYAVEYGWWAGKRPVFGHGETAKMKNGIYLVGSYHPSQQNTFTGRLTEEMLDAVFSKARRLLNEA